MKQRSLRRVLPLTLLLILLVAGLCSFVLTLRERQATLIAASRHDILADVAVLAYDVRGVRRVDVGGDGRGRAPKHRPRAGCRDERSARAVIVAGGAPQPQRNFSSNVVRTRGLRPVRASNRSIESEKLINALTPKNRSGSGSHTSLW